MIGIDTVRPKKQEDNIKRSCVSVCDVELQMLRIAYVEWVCLEIV